MAEKKTKSNKYWKTNGVILPLKVPDMLIGVHSSIIGVHSSMPGYGIINTYQEDDINTLKAKILAIFCNEILNY